MSTTYYYSAGGEMFGEHTLGQSRLDYIPDALGSVTATVDQSLTVQSTARYKPYGADLATTGTVPKFGWVGTLGYRRTGNTHADIYVRARTYGSAEGMWTSVDPLWPDELAYGYVKGNPAIFVDPSGRKVQICHRGISISQTIGVGDSCGVSHWGIDISGPNGCGMAQFNQEGITFHTVDKLGRDENWDKPGELYPYMDDPNPHRGSSGIMYRRYPTKRNPPVSPWGCKTIAATPAQERCLCKNARLASAGYLLNGTTWLPRNEDPTWKDVNFCDESARVHDCQGFVVTLLKSCGMESPWDRTYDVVTAPIRAFPVIGMPWLY